MTEQRRLEITQSDIDRTEEHVDLTIADGYENEGTRSFTTGILKRLKGEQKNLFAFLATVPEKLDVTATLSYYSGVVLTYDMIPDSIRLAEEISHAKLSEVEQSLKRERTIEIRPTGNTLVLETDWITARMSDPYRAWWAGMVSDLEDSEDQKDFTLGCFTIVAAYT